MDVNSWMKDYCASEMSIPECDEQEEIISKKDALNNNTASDHSDSSPHERKSIRSSGAKPGLKENSRSAEDLADKITNMGLSSCPIKGLWTDASSLSAEHVYKQYKITLLGNTNHEEEVKECKTPAELVGFVADFCAVDEHKDMLKDQLLDTLKNNEKLSALEKFDDEYIDQLFEVSDQIEQVLRITGLKGFHVTDLCSHMAACIAMDLHNKLTDEGLSVSGYQHLCQMAWLEVKHSVCKHAIDRGMIDDKSSDQMHETMKGVLTQMASYMETMHSINGESRHQLAEHGIVVNANLELKAEIPGTQKDNEIISIINKWHYVPRIMVEVYGVRHEKPRRQDPSCEHTSTSHSNSNPMSGSELASFQKMTSNACPDVLEKQQDDCDIMDNIFGHHAMQLVCSGLIVAKHIKRFRQLRLSVLDTIKSSAQQVPASFIGLYVQNEKVFFTKLEGKFQYYVALNEESGDLSEEPPKLSVSNWFLDLRIFNHRQVLMAFMKGYCGSLVNIV